jgi:hypothetical protein
MKKLLLGLAIVTLSLSGTSATYATSDCRIYGSGPDSVNTCESIEDFRCTVDNENNIKVYNGNDQEVDTGDAEITGNTSGGSSTSGDSNNTNSTVVEGTIKNNACVVAAEEEEVVTPPAPVAPSGGQGAVAAPAGGQGAVTPVAAPSKAAPMVLPNTSAESTVGIVAGLVAALGLAVIGSRFAVGAYGNLKS